MPIVNYLDRFVLATYFKGTLGMFVFLMVLQLLFFALYIITRMSALSWSYRWDATAAVTYRANELRKTHLALQTAKAGSSAVHIETLMA